jgi:Pyridine nucleotide-disulphide oxidoreductase
MVIVGGGMAGGNAAVTLREEGFRDTVTMIGPEPGVPFGRPPLSKTYLRSEEDLADWYVRPASWYEQHDVDRLDGSAVAVIDTAAHTVLLGSGQKLPYRKVLIATGGRNRRLKLPGADLPGIHYLRTVAECEAIRGEAVAGRRAVVVGMGFIGSEVAASLTQLGVHVTAIFPGRFPLERVLGGEIGALFGAIHRAKGVGLLAGDQVAAFEGTERLEAVVTVSGVRVECDFAVAGVGIEPVAPAITGQPVAQDNGVLVDELCRAMSRTIFTRYSAGSVSSTTTTPRNKVARRRDRCWARMPPTTTSIPSGQTSTTISSNMPATPRRGMSSWSAAAWRKGDWSASISSAGWCGPRSGSTAAVTPNWTATRRWRRLRASWRCGPSLIPGCSPTSGWTCGRWGKRHKVAWPASPA